MSQVSLVPISLWVAAILFWGVAVWRGPKPLMQAFVIDRLLPGTRWTQFVKE